MKQDTQDLNSSETHTHTVTNLKQLNSNLCGTSDWLASSIAASNHHLLGEEDLLRGDLDTQVTTGNHDAITGLHYLIKPASKHDLFMDNYLVQD